MASLSLRAKASRACHRGRSDRKGDGALCLPGIVQRQLNDSPFRVVRRVQPFGRPTDRPARLDAGDTLLLGGAWLHLRLHTQPKRLGSCNDGGQQRSIAQWTHEQSERVGVAAQACRSPGGCVAVGGHGIKGCQDRGVHGALRPEHGERNAVRPWGSAAVSDFDSVRAAARARFDRSAAADI